MVTQSSGDLNKLMDKLKYFGRKNGFAIVLVVFGVLLRLLPHMPNFVPVGAIALFGGSVLGRRSAIVIPLTIMVVSDIILGLHSVIGYTWGAFLLIGVFAFHYLRGWIDLGRIITASLVGSTIFFFISNLGVWLSGFLYPLTLAGLVQCYYMALPFFRSTIVSDLLYSGVLFGIYALAQKLVARFSIV